MGQYVAAVVAEGCAAFFWGRPREENPYSRESAPGGWRSWNHGWMEARALEDAHGEEERKRWGRRAWDRDPEVRELVDAFMVLLVWVQKNEELLSFFHAEVERQRDG